MKEKSAIALSIFSFALIYFGLDAVADFLGVPTYIDFGETVTVTRGSGRYSYEEDIDGESTDVGIYILIVSIMLAWRVYHWVISGNIKGDLSKESHTTWFYWLGGITTYILVATPVWYIDMPAIMQRIVVLVCGAGIAWFLYNKHDEAIRKIRDEQNKKT